MHVIGLVIEEEIWQLGLVEELLLVPLHRKSCAQIDIVQPLERIARRLHSRWVTSPLKASVIHTFIILASAIRPKTDKLI
jgi:hypothetical protein